ncbi:MAG: hypothetical protein ACO1OB_23880 [Archangium sp.]
MRTAPLMLFVTLSACAPDMKAYFEKRAPEVKALREKLGKAATLVDAQPTSEAKNACSASLTLNLFDQPGNTAVLSLEDARAAAEAKPEPKSSLATPIGGGEQATMTVLHWASQPSGKAEARVQKAVDATMNLSHVIVLRDKSAPGAIDVDAFLVDLSSMRVVCDRHFGVTSDGKATENSRITGGGEADNAFQVTATDRMKAGLGQQLKDSLRADFKLQF